MIELLPFMGGHMAFANEQNPITLDRIEQKIHECITDLGIGKVAKRLN